MKRRGRPPHPDILTPREWEVLGLLRDGLSNPEIAERLGVTRDAVKYHVSEILSKLGVASRDEAALWRAAERPWWAAAIAALAGAASRLSPLGRIAAIGLSVGVLAGLALLAYGLFRNGENESESRAAVAPVASGTPSGKLGATEGGTLVSGPEVRLTEDYALIVATGCSECDGPNTGVARVYKLGGQVVSEIILDPATLGFGPRKETNKGGLVEEGRPYLGRVVATADASEIWASICVRERCGIGGMDALTPGSQTAIVRSTDGGVTWNEVGRVDVGRGDVISMAGPGRVIVMLQEGDSQVLAYFPGLEMLTPPEPGFWPLAFIAGRVLWHSFDNGRVWLGDELLHDFGDGNHVSEAIEVIGVEPRIGVSLQTATGAEFDTLDLSGHLLDSHQYGSLAIPHVDVGKGLLVGNATIDASRLTQPLPQGSCTWFPVFVDLSSGEIRPTVEGFTSDLLRCGRNDVLAVQRGPFARVANSGSCLDVRESPDPAAPVLECVANSVLLLDQLAADRLIAETPVAGGSWLRVWTPAGQRGYARAEFLQH